MNNLNDYCQNFQKAAQEKSFVESRKHYKEWRTNLTREWGNQKDQLTSIMVKLSEAYLPNSKKHLDQAEKLYRENFGEMISKSREPLNNKIDEGIKNTLIFEKEWFSKLRENYSIVAENLLKQFDGLMTSFSSSAKAASPKTSVGKTVEEDI